MKMIEVNKCQVGGFGAGFEPAPSNFSIGRSTIKLTNDNPDKRTSLATVTGIEPAEPEAPDSSRLWRTNSHLTVNLESLRGIEPRSTG